MRELAKHWMSAATVYGSSVGHYSKDQVRFNRGHIYITVHVRNNHSIREDFGPEAGGTLSDAQIDTILKDNAKGYKWEKVGESANVVRLLRSDGHARARSLSRTIRLTKAE